MERGPFPAAGHAGDQGKYDDGGVDAAPGDEAFRTATYRKCAWRLIPFLALLYFISFIDRVNISFAALAMNAEIGLSQSAFGFGAGVFFLGYILFAIPANLVLERIGAARWMAIISILWGTISMGMALAQTPAQFYILRFLLGAAESGFFPGVILYLSTWFPDRMRGRFIGNFFIAVPLSNVLGAPLSAWLMTHSLGGLAGWQTMFIVEALPAIALGVVALAWLPDRPASASWLTLSERNLLEQAVPEVSNAPDGPPGDLFRQPMPWLLGSLYFCIVLALYGFGFFAPQILAASGGLSIISTGVATALPYGAATIVMIVWARHSDAKQERVRHLILASVGGGIGFIAAAFAPGFGLTLLAFSIAAAGVYAACPVFWAFAAYHLPRSSAAAGIALVNSIGNLAGYAGPFMMGALKDQTGSYTAGISALGAAMGTAVVVTLMIKDQSRASPEPQSRH